jgi:EamA domain-containing membrane protein RarD
LRWCLWSAIATGLWQLANATNGLVIDRLRVGTIPVTVFRPASGPPAPVVVIAHGFAGSQQLMLPAFGILMSADPAVSALVGLLVLAQHLDSRKTCGIACVVVASIGTTATRRPRVAGS